MLNTNTGIKNIQRTKLLTGNQLCHASPLGRNIPKRQLHTVAQLFKE